MGQEKTCGLELLRGWRGFALGLGIWEMLGLPDVVTVPFQGILILDLLGHQNSKFVMLHFQLYKTRARDTTVTKWKTPVVQYAFTTMLSRLNQTIVNKQDYLWWFVRGKKTPRNSK